MTRAWVYWTRWLALYIGVTLVVWLIADTHRLRISHGVLLYLLLVVGASREGGRWLAATMVTLSYLAVDFFFVPPRGAFGIPAHRDLVLLVGFAITSGVIAQLLVSLRQAALIATERTAEIERLSAERIRLERAALRADVLQEAERLRSAMLASVSHDLRSPIMAMTMLCDPASGVRPVDALPRISEHARQLSEYLTTLTRFAGSDDGGDVLRIEKHTVEELIGAAVRASAAALRDHELCIVPETGALPLIVRCDFTLSLQALGNILRNAARYSPEGSVIEVHASVVGNVVRVIVSDRGPGIAADEVEMIFQPMLRGRGTQAQPGSGMGLSIARTFARAQGGDVRYRPRPDGGSHFELSLPAASIPALITI